jgi:hypothetical protein
LSAQGGPPDGPAAYYTVVESSGPGRAIET